MALVKGTNSYAEVAEANAYFSDRIGSELWSASDDATKAKALITATRLIDEIEWLGTALLENQSLAFPRTGSYFEPRRGAEIELGSSTPDRIVNATFELALHLVSNNDILSSTGGVTDLEVGSVKLTSIMTPSVIPTSVKRIYRPLLQNQSGNTWWRAN